MPFYAGSQARLPCCACERLGTLLRVHARRCVNRMQQRAANSVSVMHELLRLQTATHSSEQVRTQVDAHAPGVLVLAGMDTPPTPRMLATWTAASAHAALPDHRVVLATLLRDGEDALRSAHPLELEVDVPQRQVARSVRYRYRRGEAFAREIATKLMRWADERSEFDEHGRPLNWIAARMAPPIRLPFKYLYDARHEAQQRARVLALVRDPSVTTVVGCSFGGSIALDCLIRFYAEGLLPASRTIRLLTLGSNLGSILTRSALYRSLPRDADGKIAVPKNVRWQHFVSPSDVFVGAHARPDRFGHCEQIEVETGPLLAWPPNQAHGVSRYLATAEVRYALQEALQIRPSVNSAEAMRGSSVRSSQSTA